MLANVIQGCEGLGQGYSYASANGKAKEVRKGKNFPLASLYQTGEVFIVSSLVAKAAGVFFQGTARTVAKMFLNTAPFVWFPIGILLASVKSGGYTKLVESFPKTLGRVLPHKLGQTTTRVLNFIHDQASICIKVAMLVSVVSLAFLGFHIFCSVLAASWFFHEIDTQGYLPRKVSLFCERYKPMTILSNVCLAVAPSGLFLRTFSIVSLACNLSLFNRFLIHKVDSLFSYFFTFSFTGPSLVEFEAPVKEVGDMSYQEINQILNGKEEDFRINPAHCSKEITHSFPKNYNFQALLYLFDQMNWKEDLIVKKLNDDNRFQSYLRENRASDNLDCIQWMRGELEKCVKALKGEERVPGEQKDLAVAIENCAIILDYLQRPSLSQIEKEDILLKLAVEAGGYCLRGLKRASGEIVNDTVMSSSLEADKADPQTSYERRLKQALQNKRRDIIQGVYQEMAAFLPEEVRQDVHGYDLYRLILTLGFYPLSSYEREKLNIMEFMMWKSYSPYHKAMMSEYFNSLDEVISEDEIHFTAYLRKYIGSNAKLSESQKIELMDRWISIEEETPKEVNERFHRLALVKLGILQQVGK